MWAYAVKEDNDWVKKCMEYEVEGARSRDRPKKTCTEIFYYHPHISTTHLHIALQQISSIMIANLSSEQFEN